MHNELPVLMFGDQQAHKGEMTISDMARTYGSESSNPSLLRRQRSFASASPGNGAIL